METITGEEIHGGALLVTCLPSIRSSEPSTRAIDYPEGLGHTCSLPQFDSPGKFMSAFIVVLCTTRNIHWGI